MADKVIVSKPIGGDGAAASLAVGDGALKLEVTYPLDKIASPLYAIVDKAIDAAEAAIPGDWDKALLEPARIAAKQEIANLLSQI